MPRVVTAVSVFLVLCSLPAQAQSGGAAAAKVAQPRVTEARPYRASRVELGIRLLVKVEGLQAWAAQPGNELSKLILFLDGYPLRNATATSAGAGTEKVFFELRRDAKSKQEWTALLGRPQFKPRPVSVTVGLADQAPFPTSVLPLDFYTIEEALFWLFLVLFLGLMILFVMLARGSDLLRDGGFAPAAGFRKPYSLARTQMAVWFFIVIASFIFIWLVTGAYDPLTPSVLGLIGISAGTALGAAIVDKNKEAAVENRGTTLEGERRRLQTEMASLDTLIAETKNALANPPAGLNITQSNERLSTFQSERAAKLTRIGQIDDELRAVAAGVQPRRSERFLDDILSDANGVSFHRFQIGVWTVVLSIIFIFTVYEGLAMPDFDEKLLALMGISAGTYLGFKFPENT